MPPARARSRPSNATAPGDGKRNSGPAITTREETANTSAYRRAPSPTTRMSPDSSAAGRARCVGAAAGDKAAPGAAEPFGVRGTVPPDRRTRQRVAAQRSSAARVSSGASPYAARSVPACVRPDTSAHRSNQRPSAEDSAGNQQQMEPQHPIPLELGCAYASPHAGAIVCPQATDHARCLHEDPNAESTTGGSSVDHTHQLIPWWW